LSANTLNVMDDFGNRRRVLKQLVAIAGTLILPAKRAIAKSMKMTAYVSITEKANGQASRRIGASLGRF